LADGVKRSVFQTPHLALEKTEIHQCRAAVKLPLGLLGASNHEDRKPTPGRALRFDSLELTATDEPECAQKYVVRS